MIINRVIWEKAMAPHSSTLAWKIPWMEEACGLQSMGLWRVGHDWVTSLSLWYIGEGNGNPLQCSCLENPRDQGAWWAAVYGVAQCWTRLKRLSSNSSSPGVQGLRGHMSETVCGSRASLSLASGPRFHSSPCATWWSKSQIQLNGNLFFSLSWDSLSWAWSTRIET